MIGNKYGRWLVIEKASSRTNGLYLLCVCECGTTREVNKVNLLNGKSKSCGCLHKEKLRKTSTTHKLYGTPAYVSWQSMKARCSYPKRSDAKFYVNRGITYCSRWERFENFLEDMGPRPPGTTLDRINNDGNYEPANCKWSTYKEQANNRST